MKSETRKSNRRKKLKSFRPAVETQNTIEKQRLRRLARELANRVKTA